MCKLGFALIPLDDPFRLTGVLILFVCWYILRQIVINEKKWDALFWVFFALFLLSLSVYGYLMSYLYSQDIFSYDVIIYGAIFITACGLLFSKNRSGSFRKNLTDRRAMALFITFFVFALLYILTLNFNFNCSTTSYWVFIILLQIVVYPLILLFGIVAFLYRFSICFSVFMIAMVLFLVEDVLFVIDAIINISNYETLLVRVIFCLVYFIYGLVSIYILNECRVFVRKD
ncbi:MULTISPECIES: hypothetical protein [unclassified Francisella]|uniref:hypothetical protein n=1 Tax=unclassified Francisella TaxID=2610885 RepID=UPI002E334C8E|nr:MULTISPECIES: hypothetical protein [unclassified Francisella]MED7818819.1 hypothetical protein [Francisella sp. 19S2-4]MED7829656.1 hypothetical protein [Francisella sp. 19S2-10]